MIVRRLFKFLHFLVIGNIEGSSLYTKQKRLRT